MSEPKFVIAEFGTWDENDAPFPFLAYSVSEDFIICKNKPRTKCFGVIFYGDKISKEKMIDIQDNFLTFASIYSFHSNKALEYTIMPNITDKDYLVDIKENIFPKIDQNALSSNIKNTLNIESILNQTKKIFKKYCEINDGKLKKHITNSLHYYYYAKKSSRKEEMIINYTIGLEILYLGNEQELSYRLSNRTSYILEQILMDPKWSIFNRVKQLYSVRSNIVHSGASKKELNALEMIKIDEYLAMSIKYFIMKSKEYDNKDNIIQHIEDSTLRKKEIIDRKSFEGYFKDDTPSVLFPKINYTV